MLSKEDNELLTRTNPGTPMGEFLRLYWIPALMSEEIPEPDCAPVRVKLLGEDLIAYRDSSGKIGLVDEFCPHRGVSLFFGKNADCGLRCAYHGWKFNTEGQCTEMPSESPESTFKNKVQIKSYPCEESGGIIWAYMGPNHVKKPPLPDIIWNSLPEGHTYVTKRIQETNYLQAVEGGVDSSHVSILHAGNFKSLNVFNDNSENVMLMETVPYPIFEVIESDFGAYMGAGRVTPKGNVYWRVNPFLMPWYTLVPPYEDEPRTAHAWVPIDDYNCMNWSINWHPKRPLREEELANMKGAKGIHGHLIPGTYRTKLNRDNNYGLDRELQRKGESLSGIKGVGMQDAAIQESQGYIPGKGAIADRTKERLGTSDSAIIAMRRIMMNAVKGYQQGNIPKSLYSSYYIQPPTKHLPQGVSIKDTVIKEFEEEAEKSKRMLENEGKLRGAN